MQDLLANYGQDSSNSSDEEYVPQTKSVNAPDPSGIGQKRKLTEPNENIIEPPKKKLKLPSIFEVEKKPDLENDPTKHGGRIRQFQHVEGNYPSHVFIKVSEPRLHELTADIIRSAQPEFDSTVNIVPLDEDWHISLSRPFPMREHHIKLFVESLRRAVESCRIPAFDAQLTDREVYVNDDKTRSFIGLNVTGPGCRHVIRLIKTVDTVMKSFAFPVFYEDPKPHVTIAWMLGDVSMTSSKEPIALEDSQHVSFTVTDVQCRIGKFNHSFKLE